MTWFFWFFFVSGFCSVLCEVIWLRLAMAQFGVTTALTSIVLSVFMTGLGLGSWLGGALIARSKGTIFPALRIYAGLELMIGLSALAVPSELVWGHRLLANMADRAALTSAAYDTISGLCLAATMIPWCACMGATIPVAMAAIRRQKSGDAHSFSFLYLANVLGAILGSFLPLLLIEPYGFHNTLLIGASLNLVIALSALWLSLRSGAQESTATPLETTYRSLSGASATILLLLFATGLATMGMELIWIRVFTPYVGPVVYSFGMILVAYLLATFVGSRIYRHWSHHHQDESRLTWVSLALFSLLPLLTADARLPLHLVARVFLGVMPFAGMIGFLTPMLVDRWAGNDPDRAGRAYAVNVVGCIIGPILCGFLLLPNVGERWSMLLLALPWFLMAIPLGRGAARRPYSQAAAYGILLSALAVLFGTQDFETQFPIRKVRRDSTATVIAQGEGDGRRLLVNGMGMTKLTPITKMMAHLTLSSLDHQPRSALVICFGMGTTFRSVISWNVSGTAVELVPSVPKMFSFYHADAASVKKSPFAHIVIDDGRRYLERSPAKYDAIIVDPPPPIQTAGSSLLYSQDFYAVAKQRLEPGGILQQWLPEADEPTQSAVTRAIKSSFAYVRVFRGMEGWGWHFLASDHPIATRSASDLVAHMPESAVRDMMEWGPAHSPTEQMRLLLDHETTTDSIIALSPSTKALTDDRPINEYFLLRTPFDRLMAMQ